MAARGEIPGWRRGDLTDRVGDWMNAEAIYERQVGDVLQVIERVVFRDHPTQDMRPFYRLTEVKAGKARVVRTLTLRAALTQREVRFQADRRARQIMGKASEPPAPSARQ